MYGALYFDETKGKELIDMATNIGKGCFYDGDMGITFYLAIDPDDGHIVLKAVSDPETPHGDGLNGECDWNVLTIAKGAIHRHSDLPHADGFAVDDHLRICDFDEALLAGYG